MQHATCLQQEGRLALTRQAHNDYATREPHIIPQNITSSTTTTASLQANQQPRNRQDTGSENVQTAAVHLSCDSMSTRHSLHRNCTIHTKLECGELSQAHGDPHTWAMFVMRNASCINQLVISLATLTLDFRRLRMPALLVLNPACKAHSYRDAFRPC